MTAVFIFPSRLPDFPLILIVIFYIPIGLVLAVARFFVLLHALLVSYLLPKGLILRGFVLRCMAAVLGTFVTVKREKGAVNHLTLVSNHPTLFDHVVLDLVVPSYSPYTHLFHWGNGYQKISQSTDSDEVIRKRIIGSKFPFHFLPEYVPTGYSNVLLSFPPVPFGLDRVQPVSIRATRLVPVGLTCHPVVWWRELFWHLFVPYTHYQVQLHPAARRSASETAGKFAERLRRIVSDSLQARLLDLTANDLRKQLMQNREIDAEQTGSNVQDPRLQLMLTQVQEVLPQLPANVIEAELRRTRDVDTAIATLLEGDHDSTEGVDSESVTSTSSSFTCSSRSKMCTPSAPQPVPPASYRAAATSFGHSTGARHLSLTERKKAFMENARQRYLAKHGQSN